MAPIKLLSSDLDGTIIFDRAIGPDSIQAIHQWQQAGNIAVCSTGKSIEATRFALRDSGLEFDYNVLYTGAVVTDKHYNVLMSHTLPSALVSELVQKLSEEQGISVFATTLDTNDVRLYSSIPPELSTDILQYFDPLKYEDIPHHTFVGIPIWVSAGDETEKTIQRLHTWILDTYGDVLSPTRPRRKPGTHRNCGPPRRRLQPERSCPGITPQKMTDQVSKTPSLLLANKPCPSGVPTMCTP